MNSSACVSRVLFSLLHPKDPKHLGAALCWNGGQKLLCRLGAQSAVQRWVIS